jgi:CRISPR-associated protein Cmr3
MNTILLHPTDVLFFRDGRPMGGSLSGHAAAWPLPTVVNHAFHSALHRAGDIFNDVHPHRRGRSSARPENAERDRKFGCLTTAGPFPVKKNDAGSSWFFPRPLDAGLPANADISFRPLKKDFDRTNSSLPQPLSYPVANERGASKATPERWFSAAAFQNYLGGKLTLNPKTDFIEDSTFADTEFTYGIGIDPETDTQDGERFYSASYLRLREGWRLGVLAAAEDKEFNDPIHGRDLVRALLNGHGAAIIAGGQQRVCRAVIDSSTNSIPLPHGATITGTRVKWVLLTPAIFPAINKHPGGWLPSWVDLSGEVQLLDGPGKNYAKRHKVSEGNRIPAKLVAAITGKPIPVTGYALPHESAERTVGGPKPTHLAVPAGAVYFFEAEGVDEAAKQANALKLAVALNWHGRASGAEIQNRRSTLMGEKGFGLGVCATWEFHSGRRPNS